MSIAYVAGTVLGWALWRLPLSGVPEEFVTFLESALIAGAAVVAVDELHRAGASWYERLEEFFDPSGSRRRCCCGSQATHQFAEK